jgi:hypothetical protein
MPKMLIILFLLLNCSFGTGGKGADLANVGVCLWQGEYVEAGFNAIAIIPIIGDAVKGGKMATKGASTVAGVVSQGAKHGDDAVKAGTKAAGDGATAGKKVIDNCKPGSGSCFTAGTQVVVGAEFTEDDVFVQYVTVNIEDIKVGDFVFSYDTITGEVSQKEVTAVFVRESDHINYLTIVDEQGCEQILETTDGHPFWVVTDEPDLSRAARSVVDENGFILYHENLEAGLNGFWVEAKDLREGDIFIGANGELSILVSAERVVFPENIKVYNFTVDGNHDYFVIAQVGDYGQTCVLVHNARKDTYGDDDWKDDIKNITGQNPSQNKPRPDKMRAGHVDEQSQINAIKRNSRLSKGQQGMFDGVLKKEEPGKGNLTVSYERLQDIAKQIKKDYPNH